MQIRRRRCRGDDGTAMVEGALVALPFFILLMGILEFGLFFKDYLGVSAAAAVGARTATTQADDLTADYHILTAVDRAAAALDRDDIERIVIFRADAPNDGPAVGCRTEDEPVVGIDGECNVYFVPSFELGEGEFDCDDRDGDLTDGTAQDQHWCAADRHAYRYNNDGSQHPDYIGVQIEYNFQFVTGMFGSTKNFTSTTILRIEPQGRNEPS